MPTYNCIGHRLLPQAANLLNTPRTLLICGSACLTMHATVWTEMFLCHSIKISISLECLNQSSPFIYHCKGKSMTYLEIDIICSRFFLVLNPLNTSGRYTGRYVKVHIPWRPVYRPLTCAFCLQTLRCSHDPVNHSNVTSSIIICLWDIEPIGGRVL